MSIIVPIEFGKLSYYESQVFEYVNNKYLGSCTNTHGYIVKIINVNILNNIISRSQPTVLFQVQITVLLFNPSVGDIVKCNVVKLFSEGIWTEIKVETITVCLAIPKNNIKGMRDIQIGENLDVKISNVHFDGKINKYIGTLDYGL